MGHRARVAPLSGAGSHRADVLLRNDLAHHTRVFPGYARRGGTGNPGVPRGKD
jgi:hypothetical protein